MATKTLGSSTTSVLVAVAFSPDPAVLATADLATINQHILDDQNVAHPVAHLIGSGGFVREGHLYVPNRGFLTVLPGDYVAYDPATGWPILLSSRAAAGASWVHS
jgi:hypothetical protein